MEKLFWKVCEDPTNGHSLQQWSEGSLSHKATRNHTSAHTSCSSLCLTAGPLTGNLKSAFWDVCLSVSPLHCSPGKGEWCQVDNRQSKHRHKIPAKSSINIWLGYIPKYPFSLFLPSLLAPPSFLFSFFASSLSSSSFTFLFIPAFLSFYSSSSFLLLLLFLLQLHFCLCLIFFVF